MPFSYIWRGVLFGTRCKYTEILYYNKTYFRNYGFTK